MGAPKPRAPKRRPTPAPARKRTPEPGSPAAKSFFSTLVKLVLIIGLAALAFGTIFNTGVIDPRGLGAASDDDDHGIKALDGGYPMVGAWLGDWPSDENGLIDAFEEDTGYAPDYVDVFLDWKTPYANVSHTVEHISAKGGLAMLTWEPRDYTHAQIINGKATTTLRDGRTVPLDAYLAEFADGLCETTEKTREPVLIRTLHEMNGDWYPWGIGYKLGDQSPNSDDSFKRAWIKVHDIFEERCPDKARFVYTINHFSGGGTSFMGGYPGDAYVDMIGLDGYNWGSRAPWGWQSFSKIFTDAYCAVTAQTEKPIIVAEMAASESGGDKAAWLRSTYQAPVDGQFPQIQGLTYFHEAKFEIEINGEMDWAYDTSESSRAAFVDQITQYNQLREDGGTWTAPSGASVCG